MKQIVKPGDTVIVPEYLNDGERCMAKVLSVYNRFVLLETENNIKLTIQLSEFHKTNGVIKATSEEMDELEKDILINI